MQRDSIKPHKKLDVWKKQIDFTVDVYKLTEAFPRTEIYGLAGQMRRATVSIPSNIAEGAARHTKKEFINFLHTAQGTLSELDTQLVIASKLGYFSEEVYGELDARLETISKMLTGLIKALKM